MLNSLISLIKLIIKALSEKDPPFLEVFTDYEEYHQISHVSPLAILRAKLISEWIEPKSTILDVGCGEGFIMEYLHRTKSCECFGIDISHKAIEKVRSKGFNAVVRDVDLKGLGLSENEIYDYILFVEVLEHLKYPHKVLLQACRHIRKGVIVTIPNTGFIKWRLQLLRGYFPRQSFTHLHFWTIRDFELFLKSLGLRPIALKTELDLLQGIKRKIANRFRNLLAYQQCWLIAPYK